MAHKVHLNDVTGVVGRCEANERACRFEHFDTVAEARDRYGEIMEEQKLKKMQHDAVLNDFRSTARGQKLVKCEQDIEESTRQWKNLDKYINDLEKKPGYRRTRDWYEKVQLRREMYYQKLALESDRMILLPKEAAEIEIEQSDRKRRARESNFQDWAKRKNSETPHNFHPEITAKNEKDSLALLSTMSGESKDLIAKRINDLVEVEGISRTEAHTRAFNALPLRQDKPIVSLVTHVAAPDMDGKVDTGPYSTIIEMNYTIRYPNGSMKSKVLRSGISKNLATSAGTGAEHIHGISLDDVRGRTPLTRNNELMEEIKHDLRGSVILGHNTKFLKEQLGHSLPGFNGATERGDIEFIDTMDATKMYLRDTPDNRHDSYLAAAGVEPADPAKNRARQSKVNIDALLKIKAKSQVPSE